MLRNPFRSLDDQALTESLRGRVRYENSNGVDIILHLMVVLERRIPAPPPHSRCGAQADRDAVTIENDCRCTFVSPEGRRCNERAYLQIDHKVPWAVAHNSAQENLRPMCAAHNLYLAELQFGPPPPRATAISRRGS